MIKKYITKLINGIDLSEEEVFEAFNLIMEGNATQAQIGSFLTALRIKGETVDEITGCAKVMREKAQRINPNIDFYIDTCGTGGDGANTFNISTASAFVAAAGGVTVAKHGNRSVSSQCGSADVLEALGVNLDLDYNAVEKCIEDIGIGFMFAPMYHKAMKHAAGPRKELGIRTIFNLVGPLSNPAGAKGQVIGLFDRKLLEPIAMVLGKLGVEHALVVHGSDGLDELTTTGATNISELKNGNVLNYEINPETFGLKRANSNEIIGGNAKENAEIIINIFSGMEGAKKDIVVLNSAAALYVGKKANSIAEGVKLAEQIISSGAAFKKVEELSKYTNSYVIKKEEVI